MSLKINGLACAYGTHRVFAGMDFELPQGEVLCLLGPNGVGKTTLFKTLLGFLAPLAGSMSLDGEDIRTWSDRRRARSMAYVPQSHIPPFPFSVLEVVIMGCASRLGSFSAPSKKDHQRARQALATLGIASLEQRIYTELSGGERQLVLIARALVQEPRILILDEPTSNLDFGNQVRVLDQVNRLALQGMSIIMTTHFPNHVFLCQGRVILMGRNGTYISGTADEVVNPENLHQVYGIHVEILEHRTKGGQILKTCLPLMEPSGPGIPEIPDQARAEAEESLVSR